MLQTSVLFQPYNLYHGYRCSKVWHHDHCNHYHNGTTVKSRETVGIIETKRRLEKDEMTNVFNFLGVSKKACLWCQEVENVLQIYVKRLQLLVLMP